MLYTPGVSIIGPGANLLTIDGNAESRILEVTAPGSNIAGITFHSGSAAGALTRGIVDPEVGGAISYAGVIVEAAPDPDRVPIKVVSEARLTSCTFSQNHALSDGGAIYNSAILVVDSCTFDSNYSESDGGGIVQLYDDVSTPSLTIFNSTFYNNSAEGDGGAIAVRGGAFQMFYSTLTLNVSDANEGGVGNGALAVDTDSGVATISSNIIAQNVDASPVVAPKRAADIVLRGGPSENIPDVMDFTGNAFFGSLGYNVIGDINGTPPGFTQSTDQYGFGNAPLDALVQPLADNGGGILTCGLGVGSPARDAGDPNLYPPFDQIAQTRFLGFGPDSGSREVDPVIEIAVFSAPDGEIANGATVQSDDGSVGQSTNRLFTIRNDGDTTLTIAQVAITGGYSIASNIDGTQLTPNGTVDFVATATPAAPGPVFGTITISSNDPDEDPYVIYIQSFFCSDHITVTNTGDSGPGSLREALALVCPNGLIDFDESLVGGTITLTSGDLNVDTDNITIQGLGARNLTISGNNQSRIFYTDVETVTINDLKLTDGLSSDTLNRGQGDFSPGVGGAICVRGGPQQEEVDRGLVFFPETGLFLNRVQVENSTAEYVGGAIFAGGVVTIDSCTFVGNHGAFAGGAIYNEDSTFIVNSTFTENQTDGDGGAIFNGFGFVYSEFNTIVDNTADEDGDGNGEGGGIATALRAGRSTEKIGPFLRTTIVNTVVANNADNSTVRTDPGRGAFGNNYPDLYAGSATDFNSLGGNIIGDSAGSNGTVFDLSDQVGAPGVPLLVAMGSLSDNGGSTDTLMPGSESIALDAANEDTTRSLDQRGIGRPIGKGYDVGAVERRYIAASIAIEGGDNQKTNINTNFADPLVVSVLDGEGLPAAGRNVRFTAPVSGASLTIAGDPQIIEIGDDGLTSLSVTANGTIGSYQVIAVPEDTEVPGVLFNLTNTALPIAICQPVTVEAGANCQADVTADQIDNGSNDPDGGTISLTMNPSGPFGLGTTPVVLTVTDDEGDSTSCESSVTVQDTTPPVITCPTNIAVGPSDANCHASVTISPATATDNCAVTITNSENANGADASGTYSAGPHAVTFTATDSSGNISTCSVSFTVNCSINCEFSETEYEAYPGDIATVTLSLFVLNSPDVHTPIPNTEVHFQVVSGPNMGVMEMVTTDENGVATLDLASAEEGEDSIVASGTTENGAFNCTTTLVWEAPDHIDIPFDESPQGWQYFSPEPFLHPTSSSNASLGITPNDNTNSFGFWLSPLIVTGRPDDSAVTSTDGERGLQNDEFAEITDSEYYRVTYGLRSDSTDLSTVPTVRLRANTESLQQSDVLVVTASENGDYSPSTSMRHYPFYIHMPQGDRRFTLSFDLLNFDARDSATTSLFLDHVMIDAFDMTPFYDGESREELHQEFTESQTHGWTGRDAAGFLDVAFPSADPLGLKIVGTESTTPPRGNAFAVQYAYWGSPEGANLVTMDHTRLYQAFFFFTSGATEETKSNVPTFRGRVNSGNMKYAVYVLSESMNANCVTPVGEDAQVYSITFQTPAELDGQEMLFSYDWLWVSVSDNDPSIPVYLREISVSSFPLGD